MNYTIPLQITELQDDGFHPLVKAVIFGKPFILVVDTGASRTAFDKALLEHANEKAEFLQSDKLSTGLGTNTMASFTADIHDMQIGDFCVPEFEVAVLDLSAINHAYRQLNMPQVLGVLGGDILVKYRAIIDYGNSTMILQSS